MVLVKDGQVIIIESVGNPALGLSDAVVGTMGRGQCEEEDPGYGDRNDGVPDGSGWGPTIGGCRSACCCCYIGSGGASDLLIDKSEIVL